MDIVWANSADPDVIPHYTIRVSNSVDPVQLRRFVGSDLDQNRLQGLSANSTTV